MEKTTQWGILGLGKIAHKFTQDLLLVPGNQLAAVGSRDAETAAAFARQYGARQAYGNYEALLADPAVEIIYVATPHDSHAQWSIAALEAGKHVLCEKPLAVNRKQVDAILEAARRNNRFLMEGLWSRFNPSIQQSLK
ncbi:MAG: Gfo/Idh/MocA family oxidoreductase, partial [Saprospiraceae bacterium]|nr:Gfo/Idh/MocA family oxidoreductase [Saprospiraceae bacterium]